MAKWLHIMLFKNTLAFMDEGTSLDKLAKYIRKNCYESIFCKIKVLREKILEHKDTHTSTEFLEKWDLLPKKDDALWADKIDNALDELIEVFEDSPEIVVAESYVSELDKKKNDLINFKPRLTHNNMKKISRADNIEEMSEDIFKAPLPKIFIQYAMIPYFSKNQNSAQLEHYLKWLSDLDNLLKVSGEKEAAPKYHMDEKESIRRPVEGYIEANGFSFDERSFFDMMKILFNHLSALSEYHKLKSIEIDDQEILADVKKTYMNLIFPNSDGFIETIGVSEDELNILIDDAADDTLTAYHTYCRRFKDDQQPSWNKCISYGGFYVEMLYFLYSRLWQHESFYLKEIALYIRDLGWDSKTFIHQEAIIAPTAFIKEDCIIEKAEILDNVFLSNCRIDNGAIIKEGVIIDPTPIVIEKGTHVEEGTVIQGSSYTSWKI